VAVTGVTHAADQVRPGDLYAALPGSRRHGNEFAAAAVEAGAAAILTDTPIDAGVPTLVVGDPRAVLGTVSDQCSRPTSAPATSRCVDHRRVVRNAAATTLSRAPGPGEKRSRSKSEGVVEALAIKKIVHTTT